MMIVETFSRTTKHSKDTNYENSPDWGTQMKICFFLFSFPFCFIPIFLYSIMGMLTLSCCFCLVCIELGEVTHYT